MEWFQELLHNRFLITGLSSWFIAQVLKVIIYACINKKLDWERLFGDGKLKGPRSVAQKRRHTKRRNRRRVAAGHASVTEQHECLGVYPA